MSSEQDAQTAFRQEEVAREMGTQVPEAGSGAMEADTAFVVFVQNGMAFATADLGEVKLRVQGQEVSVQPARPATPEDMYRYSMEIAKDVQVAETAAATARYLEQQQSE